MTICISAIATCQNETEQEEAVVFATDHMISVGNIGQFEKDIKKYKQINTKAVAMLSGQTLLFDKAIEGTNEINDFFKIRNKIYENMANLRKEIIQKEIHNLFSINEDYIRDLLKNEIKNPFVQNILQSISEFNLKTGILLVGFDEKGKAQISEIDERGFADYRDIHFHTIGSGSIQALNTLLFQNHAKKYDLKTTIYNVYKAKRNAEVANGVGKETEVAVLKNNRELELLKDTQLKILSYIYETELKFGVSHQDLNRLFT